MGFGAAVRQARLARGESQICIARRLRKSPAWLCRVERGSLTPPTAVQLALCAVLHLDPQVILTCGQGQGHEPAP